MTIPIVVKRFDEVTVGERIDGSRYSPTTLHANLMNIANWGTHRIHYDKVWALQDGFDDVVVQGALLYAWIEKMLVGWAGDPAFIRKLSFRNVSVPLVGQVFEVSGVVTGKGTENEVRCDVFVRRVDGEPAVIGSAVLRLSDPQGHVEEG
jgi:hydroxyacyl-ACP dehydratase HTD2-like protein with hotdog domain